MNDISMKDDFSINNISLLRESLKQMIRIVEIIYRGQMWGGTTDEIASSHNEMNKYPVSEDK